MSRERLDWHIGLSQLGDLAKLHEYLSDSTSGRSWNAAMGTPHYCSLTLKAKSAGSESFFLNACFTASDLIAFTVIGISPCPVMKMMGMHSPASASFR
jgi:hypothetical protein